MACGCAKKISKNKRVAQKKATAGTVVRKRRVSRLISIPGTKQGTKVGGKTKG
jgi:hypothetical protein